MRTHAAKGLGAVAERGGAAALELTGAQSDAIRDRGAVVARTREVDDVLDERGIAIGRFAARRERFERLARCCARGQEIRDLANLRRCPHRLERTR